LALWNWDSFIVWNCLIFEVVKLCRMKKYLKFFYDAGTITFHYTILYSLYSDQIESNETLNMHCVLRWCWKRPDHVPGGKPSFKNKIAQGNHIWVDTTLSLIFSGLRNESGPKWVGAQMSWGPNELGPKCVGAQMSQGPNELGTKCVGAQMSRGPNESGPKWVGAQMCWGPNESGAQMRIGPKCVPAILFR
jgi:hypothetical protein